VAETNWGRQRTVYDRPCTSTARGRWRSCRSCWPGRLGSGARHAALLQRHRGLRRARLARAAGSSASRWTGASVNLPGRDALRRTSPARWSRTALSAAQTSPRLTAHLVAGAVATATHGSGERLGNLATAVSALESGDVGGRARADHARRRRVRGRHRVPGCAGRVVRVTLDAEPF
jgi:hypothetical protein